MRTNLNEEMRAYLKEVSQHPLLTRDEELKLFRRLRAGDASAKQRIVEANLRFVIKIAMQYAGKGISIADLIQEGNIGLIEVCDKFDPERGFRFSTYAAFWIRQAIQMALRKQSGVIRLPIRKSRFLGQLNQGIKEFTSENGRTPTVHEMAEHFQMDGEKLEELYRVRESVLSLDQDSDQDGPALLSKVQDDTAPSPLNYCIEQETRRGVEQALSTLSDKERRVIHLRYGFDRGKAMSLRDASKVVGMSQEGVRRVERAALQKLRKPTTAHFMSQLG